jgi:hypothetical protein
MTTMTSPSATLVRSTGYPPPFRQKEPDRLLQQGVGMPGSQLLSPIAQTQGSISFILPTASPPTTAHHTRGNPARNDWLFRPAKEVSSHVQLQPGRATQDGIGSTRREIPRQVLAHSGNNSGRRVRISSLVSSALSEWPTFGAVPL